MSTTPARSEAAGETPRAQGLDMKLEVVVIPVSDVDRAKRFYSDLGWRLDADFVKGDAFRGVQFTPPGSSCSIHFGTGITLAKPGSARGLYLVVSDIEVARADLVLAVSTRAKCSIARSGNAPRAARIRRGAATPRTPRSEIRTTKSGYCRKSPRDCPDEWTRIIRHSPHQPSWPPRSAARGPRTASTRSGPASQMRTAQLVRRVHRPGAGRQGAAVMSGGHDVDGRPQ
jgi:catechol 2,3-dioxygenase-like lactoylglutathione lyase family enzyme